MVANKIHVAMFPWFAMGHITPFLHLSNKLAEKGHTVSFLIPSRTQNSFNHLNLHPDLIQFIPLSIPDVDGLPVGAETMSDVPITKSHLLQQAFDQTQDQVQTCLDHVKPRVIFFDFAHWLPTFAQQLGAKCIYFAVVSAVSAGYVVVPSRRLPRGEQFTVENLMEPPVGYPGASDLKQLPFEAKDGIYFSKEFDGQLSCFHKLSTSMTEAQGLCFRACTETEGPFCDYIENQYKKPVFLLGPSLPDPTQTTLDEKWDRWLSGFPKGSVVYCAFGSECVLEKDQFQELLLGLELTSFPFLVRLKTPFGVETIEEALPEGFEERVKGRGVVHGSWLQQQQILCHPSVGCFLSHCGFGSMWESLVSHCQIVLLPHFGDQFVNSKFMTRVLKVAVAVERKEEDGWFTRENVCRAVNSVMEEGSEVGEEIRANHLKLRDLLLAEGLQSTYMNNFISKLQDILK